MEKQGIPVAIWRSIDNYLDYRQGCEAQDELVFSLIENCFERNRPALIPALWEMLGIPYVGSDAYASMITSDKMLFQTLCLQLGLNCPRTFEICNGTTTEKVQENILAYDFSYPMVLKYRYGTMSHGLTMVHDFEMLLLEAKRLLAEEPDSPLLCQEYISGIEATVPIVGTGNSARALALIQYAGPGQKPLPLYDKEWKCTLDDLVELIPFPQDYYLLNIYSRCNYNQC